MKFDVYRDGRYQETAYGLNGAARAIGATLNTAQKLGHGATFEITKSREQWVQLDRSGDEEMHYIMETDDWAVYKPEDSSLDVYDDETFRKTYVEEETHG